MFKKLTSLVTAMVFLIYSIALSGCTTTVIVNMDEVKTDDSRETLIASDVTGGDIKAAHTQEDTIHYDGYNAYIDSVNKVIVGYDLAHKYTSVPLSEVTALEVKRFSAWKTAGLIVAVEIVFGGLFIVAWENTY